LECNATEVQQLILLASDFVSRDRPSEVVSSLLNQLLQLAAKCSTKFQGSAVVPGGEDDASRIGAALFEATWECSLVGNDVPATIAKFADNLSLMISSWPAIARISQLALTGVMQ